MELFGGTYEDAKPFERCKYLGLPFFQMHYTCCLLFCIFMLFGCLKKNPLRWTSILILSNTENGWTHKFPTALGGELGWLTLGAPTSRLHTSRYGALGVMNDFRGVTSAYGYGDSYLVTKLPCFHLFFPWSVGRKTKRTGKWDMYPPWN